MMSYYNTLLLALFLGVVATVNSELAGANDILGDLSLYKKLYVSYQNCVWSSYADGCDVEGEDDMWYAGLTECYRANVAYSLYGILQGEEDKGCTKATFINSFFTTSGIEYFTASMAAAGVSFSENDEEENEISSDCNVVEANDGDDDGNNGYNNYAVNNYKIYSDDTSYGIGCVDNTFALKQYQGIYCDERGEPVVIDSMQTFNNEVGQAQCVVIYDTSGNNNGNNADDDEDENNEEALSVLQYSEACNIRNFPKDCPDPYGKIKKQARATEHAIAVQEHPRRERAKAVISWILLCLGIILLVGAAWAYYRKNRSGRVVEASSQKPKKKGIFSGASNAISSKRSTESSGSKKNTSNKERKAGFWGKLRKGKGRN